MSNIGVITTQAEWDSNGLGVYLHWNGGRDSVEAFLRYCELKGYRSLTSDSAYGFARLVQVITNFFGGSQSVGIGKVQDLEFDGENGVYIVDGWKIVDRKFFDGIEQEQYNMNEMLLYIDKRMPVYEQIGTFLEAEPIAYEDIMIGDTITFISYGNVITERVLGVGEDRFVNGHMVLGVPYINKYGSGSPQDNPNNYLFKSDYTGTIEYRKISCDMSCDIEG